MTRGRVARRCLRRCWKQDGCFSYETGMDLNALAVFHLVAAHGGFGRAARATSRSKATLSRRVAELERSLGLRLFERGSISLRLTEDGRSLLASTQGPLDELSAMEDALRGHDTELRGRLRVSVPLLLAGDLLGGLAARFLQRHPKVRLEMTAEDRYVDLVQEGFDVAIRANPPPNDELVGRCFLRDRLLVVAAPALSRAADSQGESLVSVPAVVRAIGNDPDEWRVEDGADRTTLRPDPMLRLPTSSIRNAVLAGAGVALLPSFHVRDDLAAGRLACWGALAGGGLEMWVLHASTRLTSRKVGAFVRFVLESFPDGHQARPIRA